MRKSILLILVLVLSGCSSFSELDNKYFKIKQESKQEALSYLNWRLLCNHSFKDGYLQRGNLHFELKHYTEAIEDFEKVRSLMPDCASCIVLMEYNIGQSYLALDEIDQALIHYTRAIKKAPEGGNKRTWAKAYGGRGFVYIRNGDHRASIKEFTAAMDLSEEAYFWANRGWAYSVLGEKDKALEDYDKALEMDPNYQVILHNRGNIYLNRGMLNLALDDFNATSGEFQKHPDFLNDRGYTYQLLGRYDEALDDFNRALKSDQKMVVARHNRANIYLARGQFLAVTGEYTRILQIKPDDLYAYAGRGNLYAALGEWSKALPDLERAVELGNDNSTVLYNLGCACNRAERYPEALVNLDRVLRVEPDWIEAVAERAVVYLDLDEPKKALVDLERVIQEQPTWVEAYYHRALALQRLGSIEAAQAYEHYLSLGDGVGDLDNFEAAKGALEELVN